MDIKLLKSTKQRLHIKIEKAIMDKLTALCLKEGVTRTKVIEKLLEEFLKEKGNL